MFTVKRRIGPVLLGPIMVLYFSGGYKSDMHFKKGFQGIMEM